MINNLKLKGSYEFEIRDINGKVRDSWKVDNLVVNGGLAFITGLLTGTGTVPTYIALGTSSTAVAGSQTTLVAEITDSGLERAVATDTQETTTVTNDTFQLTKTFTATGSKTIEEAGIFNDPTTGTMLSRALTTSKAIANGESIAVTYKLVLANA
jgi:hypothetical protein